MELKRTSHAVYDTKYHLVGTPKYSKWMVREYLRARMNKIFEEIAIHKDFEINILEIAGDFIYVVLPFSPQYSISKLVLDAQEHQCQRHIQEVPWGLQRQLPAFHFAFSPGPAPAYIIWMDSIARHFNPTFGFCRLILVPFSTFDFVVSSTETIEIAENK